MERFTEVVTGLISVTDNLGRLACAEESTLDLRGTLQVCL